MEIKKDEIQRLIKILIDRHIPPSEIARQLDTSTTSLWRYQTAKIDNPHYRIIKNLRKLTKQEG